MADAILWRASRATLPHNLSAKAVQAVSCASAMVAVRATIERCDARGRNTVCASDRDKGRHATHVMSTSTQSPVSEHVRGYRFGAAELHLASQRLFVDGVEASLSPMAYRLLLGLCRARGALLARADAFDQLWPGGGMGSDEALAQIVAKVRQALGAEGRRLVTVRGRGFRLDLPIEMLTAPDSHVPRPQGEAVSGDVTSAKPASAPALNPSRYMKPRVAFAAMAIVVVFLSVLAVVSRHAAPPVSSMVLPGFAMRVDELGPISPAGVATLQEAFAREDEGDRVSAARLYEAMLDSEPRSAAPAFFLMLWASGAGRKDEIEERRRLLKQRLPRDASPYVQLVTHWALATEPPSALSEMLTSALKIEPSAWRLRFVRAQTSIRLARLDDALVDLRAMPLDAIGPRLEAFVLGDRAALGDADEMERHLSELAQRAPATAAFVRGRIAMARERWDEAQNAFEAAAAQTDRNALLGPPLSHAWLLAAAAAGMRERWSEVVRDTQTARDVGLAHNLPTITAEAEGLLAYAQRRLEQDSLRDIGWQRAIEANEKLDAYARVPLLWLQRARMEPAWASSAPAPSSELADVDELVKARAAWVACGTPAARDHLARAEAARIDVGYFHEEADLLRADLGLRRRTAPAPPSLLYPWFIRWITFWESTRTTSLFEPALNGYSGPTSNPEWKMSSVNTRITARSTLPLPSVRLELAPTINEPVFGTRALMLVAASTRGRGCSRGRR